MADTFQRSTTETGRRPHLTLALICVAAFVVYLDTSITPVAVPAIRDEFGSGASIGQWLLDAYTLTFACLLLMAGSFGDRVGRKAVFLFGTTGFALASVWCALAPSAGALIAARAAQGVFAAAVVPLSLALTTELFTDPARRARAIGIWGGIAGVAVALGPLVGGVLVATAGWRSVFWINLPAGVLAVVGLAWALRASATPVARALDITGQALFLTASGAVTFALIEGPRLGWASAPIVLLLAVAVLGFGGFVWWERRCEHPLLPPALLRIPPVLVACVVNFLGLFGLYAVLFLMTLHLQDSLGLSPLATGVRFLALTGVLGAVAFVAPKVAARWGSRTTIVAGLLLVAGGLVGMTMLPVTDYPGYGWALVLIGAGIPLSSGVVAIQSMAGAVPPALMGTASGSMNTFRQFGAVFGVALAGVLSPQVGGEVQAMHVTFLVAAAGAIAGAVVTAVALRR